MNPVAFEIFGLEVRWYGILITLGVILAASVATRNTKYLSMNEDLVIDFLLFALPASIIGARLYYVIFNYDFYKGDLLKMINIRQGGLAIHGGLIAGTIVAIIFCKYKNIKIFDFLDIIATAVPLGQAIGRWGNFINQEAYGTPTTLPWAITVDGVKVHPTFLYESIWNIGLFIALNMIFKERKFSGQIFALYLIFYSLARFFIEGLRTDSLYFLNMRMAQLISIALIAIGIVIYIYQFKRKVNGI